MSYICTTWCTFLVLVIWIPYNTIYMPLLVFMYFHTISNHSKMKLTIFQSYLWRGKTTLPYLVHDIKVYNCQQYTHASWAENHASGNLWGHNYLLDYYCTRQLPCSLLLHTSVLRLLSSVGQFTRTFKSSTSNCFTYFTNGCNPKSLL